MKGVGAQMESRKPRHIPGVSSSVMVQPLLDGRVPYGRLQPPLTIFPIDKMRSSHIENDYIDCPAAVLRQPQSQKAGRGPQDSLLVRGPHLPLLRGEPQDVTHPWISISGRPSSVSSCSSGSTSSDHRLLDPAPHPCTTNPSPVSTRTTCFQAEPRGLKALAPKVPEAPEVAGRHAPPCQHCGRCRCTDCTLPRTLPSCWVCNQECLCSAQSLVDCASCMCLVKGVLYHCADDSEDEEGSCADRPCSCSGSHCCARWTFMSTLSFVLPCLLCYLPASGCAKLSQKCYDRFSRPGCRCKQPPPCKDLLGEKKTGEKEKQPS